MPCSVCDNGDNINPNHQKWKIEQKARCILDNNIFNLYNAFIAYGVTCQILYFYRETFIVSQGQLKSVENSVENFEHTFYRHA